MMAPCNRCLENIWEKQEIEGTVIATCSMCGYEVHFQAKKNYIPEQPKEKTKQEKIDILICRAKETKKPKLHDMRKTLPPKSYLRDV